MKKRKQVNKTDIAKNLKELTIEEKIKLLTDTDKAYISGYMDKTALDCKKNKRTKKQKTK
jgi:hypothetical protein